VRARIAGIQEQIGDRAALNLVGGPFGLRQAPPPRVQIAVGKNRLGARSITNGCRVLIRPTRRQLPTRRDYLPCAVSAE
jgi:hypothetical protein